MPDPNARAALIAEIEANGIEKVKKRYFDPMIGRMVAGHKVCKEFGVPLLATGYENYDYDVLEMFAECIIERIEDPDAKGKMQKTFDYWKSHKQEILIQHNVTA